jgi:hypothetical protein
VRRIPGDLLDPEVPLRTARDLRQVGDRHDLSPPGEPGERVGDAVRGTEDAGGCRSEPAPRNRSSVGEACGHLDRRAGELGRANDHVEALRGEDQRAHRVLRREPLDLQPVVPSLEAEGVEVVFGIPGGAILPTYDAFARGTTIRHVLARHEQGAGHMAQGYARASGRVGVAIATSGPGATNLVTPIADAWMDSTPLVCITGQLRSHLIGT